MVLGCHYGKLGSWGVDLGQVAVALGSRVEERVVGRRLAAGNGTAGLEAGCMVVAAVIAAVEVKEVRYHISTSCLAGGVVHHIGFDGEPHAVKEAEGAHRLH